MEDGYISSLLIFNQGENTQYWSLPVYTVDSQTGA